MGHLISIIIPVYNTEKYLKQCIDSVLLQSYANMEIILVNDGSTDSSPQICDDYALADSRIKVIHKANGGVGSARNSALNICTGEYIFLLDSDDYIEQNCIEIMYNRILTDKSSMCICNYRSLVNGILHDVKTKDLDDTVMTNSEFRSYFYSHISFAAQTAFRMYEKELFLNIRYPELRYGEDAYIMLEIMNKSSSISIISSPLCIYRRSESSVSYRSINNYGSVVDDENRWWDLHISYYQNNDMPVFLSQALQTYCHVMLLMWNSISSKQKKTYAPIIKKRCRMLISLSETGKKTKIKCICCLVNISLFVKVSSVLKKFKRL